MNPGRYGAELAYWLCRKLAQRKVITSYPNFEDWGWFLEYRTDAGDEFWLCCGNVEGEDEQWHCFLQPKARGLFGRKKPGAGPAAPMLDALSRVLEEEDGISDVQWEAQ